MSTQRLALTGRAIAMNTAAADKLISCGNGDAALLYVYLLRNDGFYDPAKAAKSLSWSMDRAFSAYSALAELGLAKAEGAAAAPAAETQSAPPTYSTEDVAHELETPGSHFPGLLAEVERQLGKTLSPADLKTLLELYDHLALPPEVILLLTTHLVEETKRRQGEGRRPRMSQIRAAAYRWKQQGIDTAEAVTAHLKKLDYFRSQEGTVLNLVGIRGRAAVPAEQKYITQWLTWELDPALISMAYEKTVLNTGKMNWAYCNSILRQWHQKGYRVPQDAAAGEAVPARPQPAPKAPAPAPQGKAPAAPASMREDIQWMQDFVRQHGGKEPN